MTEKHDLFSCKAGLFRRHLLTATAALSASAVAPSVMVPVAHADGLFTIRATAGANVGYSNLFVAQAAGINEKYGLTAPVRLFDVGFLGTEATLARQADVSGITEFPFVSLLAKGGKLVAVAVDDRSHDLKLVVRSQIKQPSDLSGKKIGLIYGSTAEYAFDLYKAKFDIKGVKIVNVDAADQTVTLAKGDIDGFVWLDPVVAEAFKILGNKIHILHPDIGAVYKTHLYVIMYRPWAERNRQHVEDYLRALIASNSFIRSHQRETAKIVAAKLDLPEPVIPKYIKDAGFDWNPVLTKGSIQALYKAAEWMKSKGKIREVPDLRAAVDPSYLKAVAPSHVQL